MQRFVSLVKLKNRPRQEGNISGPVRSSDEVGFLPNSAFAAEPYGGEPVITAELVSPSTGDTQCYERKSIEEPNRPRSSNKDDIDKTKKMVAEKNNIMIVSPQIIHFSMAHQVATTSQETVPCEITLHNLSTRRNSLMAFRIKINKLRVRSYTVCPNRGIIPPGKSEKISIVLTKRYHRKLLEIPSSIIDVINDQIIVQSYVLHKRNRYVKSYLKAREEEEVDSDLPAKIRLSNSLVGLFDDIDNSNNIIFTDTVVCVKLSKRRVDERMYELESIKHLLSANEYEVKKREIINLI